MLSYSSYMFTAVAALLVTCNALPKYLGIPGLPSIPELPGRDNLKGQTRLPGLRGTPGNLVGPSVKHLTCPQGPPNSPNTELRKVLVNLKHRLSRLKSVLVLKGKIREVGEKVLASNGKKVDFASALASCEDATGTLATPMNEEENKAILGIVKKYNQYAYLGIREGEDSGQFNYLNGMPVNYTKWHQNEPNGKKTEKCVEMYTDGSWNDKKCNLHRLTICEF